MCLCLCVRVFLSYFSALWLIEVCQNLNLFFKYRGEERRKNQKDRVRVCSKRDSENWERKEKEIERGNMFSCGVMFRWSLWRLGSRTPVVSCGHCTITTIELKTQPHPLPASYCMRPQLTLEGVCRRYECNQTCSTRKHTQLKTKYSILPPGWILAYIVNKLRITFCNISLMMPGIFFCLCTN